MIKKLKARYSKRQKDITLDFPLGWYTNNDAQFLAEFLHKIKPELEQRGYDITTLKFEISPKLPNEIKFPGLTKDWEEKNTQHT